MTVDEIKHLLDERDALGSTLTAAMGASLDRPGQPASVATNGFRARSPEIDPVGWGWHVTPLG
jgi:hypothetical protein